MNTTGHIVTYKLIVDGGQGEISRQATPVDRNFFDRVIISSPTISDNDIDSGFLSMKVDNETIFDEETSAAFFRQSDYVPTSENGVQIDFDINAKGTTHFTVSYRNGANPSLSGELYITIFYRDNKYPTPRINV